jgi:hypothetical protein
MTQYRCDKCGRTVTVRSSLFFLAYVYADSDLGTGIRGKSKLELCNKCVDRLLEEANKVDLQEPTHA